MEHTHPSYLNAACLPFAQQFFSLDQYDDLRYHRIKNAGEETKPDTEDDDQYESIFSKQEKRNKMTAMAQKLVAFAHFDRLNRLNLLNERPVYGRDLRESVNISLVFDADLFSVQRGWQKT